MKHILIVLDSFGFFGGPERRAYRLALGLKNKGFKVTIASIMKGDKNTFSKAHKDGIETFSITSSDNRVLKSYRIDVFFKIRKTVAKIKPDIVFTFEFLADYTTKMALFGRNLPILTFIGSTTWKWERKKHRKVFMEWFVEKSRYYIANSNTVRKNIMRVLPAAQNKIRVIYNPIDTDYFKPLGSSVKNEMKKRYGLDGFSFVIGSVVRFYNPKGADTLIDAFYKSDTDAALVLVGDGPMRKKLKKMVEDFGIKDRVLFLGAMEATPEVYAMFDICVVPSQKGGFDNVAIESMACGIPTVATKATGIAEIAEDTEDVIITNTDAESISYGIKKAMDYKKREIECCPKGRDSVKEKLDIKVIVEKIGGLL